MAFFALESAMAVYFSLWLLPFAGSVQIFSPKYSAWNYPAGFFAGVLVWMIALKCIEKSLLDKFYKIENSMRFDDLPLLKMILSLFSGALSGYILGSAVLMLMALTPATKEFIPEYSGEIIAKTEQTAMNMSHKIEIFAGEDKKLDEQRHDFFSKLFHSGRTDVKKKSSKSGGSILNRFDDETVAILDGFSLDGMFLILFAEVSSIHVYFSKNGNIISRITEVILKHFSHILELLKSGKPVPENYPEMVVEKTLSPKEDAGESSFQKIVSKPQHVMMMEKDAKEEKLVQYPVLKKKLEIIHLWRRRIIKQQLSREELMTTEIRII